MPRWNCWRATGSSRSCGSTKGDRCSCRKEAPLEAGATYSLRVSAPGFDTVRATDAIPRPAPAFVRSHRGNRGEFSIAVEIQDPPGEANYYQISIYRLSTWWRYEETLSTKDPSIMADNGVDESPLEEESFSGEAPYFKDILFDGRSHEIELTFGGWAAPGDDGAAEAEGDTDGQGSSNGKIYLQVLSISAAYYEYLKSARLHGETMDNPFAEPLNVYGNVDNGYGIFAGYSSQTFELALE